MYVQGCLELPCYTADWSHKDTLIIEEKEKARLNKLCLDMTLKGSKAHGHASVF